VWRAFDGGGASARSAADDVRRCPNRIDVGRSRSGAGACATMRRCGTVLELGSWRGRVVWLPGRLGCNIPGFRTNTG
jgi:hypothetical protein